MNVLGYGIKYTIISELGDAEIQKYINLIECEIYSEDEDGNKIEQVGRMKLNKLLIGAAQDNNYDVFRVFDETAEILEIGEWIYNFEEGEWSHEILEYYDSEIMMGDLLILERLEILPEHRKTGLAEMAIKDAYKRFSGGSSLMVLKCFPIQFESKFRERQLDEWDRKMRYDLLEKDEEQAQYQLLAFYQKIGFDIVIEDRILCVNTSFRDPFGKR